MINQIETTMYQLSDYFMAPVLLLICVLFVYALFAIGRYVAQIIQRRQNKADFYRFTTDLSARKQPLTLAGYPLSQLTQQHPNVSKDQLDVAALGEIEGVRNVSRLAPMLGLIATMVPMGPALKSLADGNIQGISENLIVAFSAVIFGLVIASITFWIASVKKRWLAEELVALTPLLVESQTTQSVTHQVINNTEFTPTAQTKAEVSNAAA